MIFGYIRVSREEQNQNLQIDALQKAGCDETYKEKVSGVAKSKPAFEKMLSKLRKGDVVVVWRIDRLGRTTLELIKLMVDFREKGIHFKSITEGIDTTTSMGRMWFMLTAIFAENEREILKERTRAGLTAARARGKIGGRPKGLSDQAKHTARIVSTLYEKGDSISSIRKALNIGSNTTIYKYLEHEGIKVSGWSSSASKSKVKK